MFRLNESRELTPNLIEKYIEADRVEQARKQKLMNYYLGKNMILNREMQDATKPNNRIANPYANYITSQMVGYFVGEPITYNSENAEMLEVIKDIFNYNDDAAENAELAQYASICGQTFELLYLDNEKNIRYKHLKPFGCIAIYDTTLEEEMLYFVRYYDEVDIETSNITTYVEVYSRSDIRYYKKASAAMELISTQPHYFGLVPVVVFDNNENRIGDFEQVISLIDAYDKSQSDSLNDLEAFEDCYLVLSGCMGTEAEDIAAMKENRVLLLDTDAKAEYLTKQINDSYLENLKTRIENDIHKFAACPCLTDEAFAGNASGVAIKYKLMGLENATAKKERAFKKALQRRIELVCNMLAVFGADYDYKQINIIFKRNIPANLTEAAEVVSKVGHLLSEQTQIEMLPLDLDATKEIEQRQQDSVRGYDDGFSNLLEEKNP